MCGIFGSISKTDKLDDNKISKIIESIKHRGPDHSEYKYLKIQDSHILLCHTRLTIIDISGGSNQPMSYDNLIMTFNGEIYNYKELRLELEKVGYTFVTSGDSEVLLKGFHYYGRKIFKIINGMFSVAFYNADSREIIIARDRAGVKPLYWYKSNDKFIFGSDLKSILIALDYKVEVSKASTTEFFKYGYIASPNTIFDNINKLEPGNVLNIGLDNFYVDIKSFLNESKINKRTTSELTAQIEDILQSSIDLRMRSDVPIGIYLSGGVDSGITLNFANKYKTSNIEAFTLGFDDPELDESSKAQGICQKLKINHNTVRLNDEDILKYINIFINKSAEPFGDESIIPMMKLSEFASEKVKVVLSSDGGDEVFCGYSKYKTMIVKNRINSFIPNLFIKPLTIILKALADSYLINNKVKWKLNKSIQILGKTNFDLADSEACVFYDSELDKLLINTKGSHQRSIKKTNTPLSAFMEYDYKYYLSNNILNKLDSSTMYYSIEGREPLLDYRLRDAMKNSDVNKMIYKGNLKYILKKIGSKYLGISYVNSKKKGFTTPVDEWIKTVLKNDFLFSLNTSDCNEIINKKYVIELFEKLLDGDYKLKKRLWLVYIFSKWKINFDEERKKVFY